MVSKSDMRRQAEDVARELFAQYGCVDEAEDAIWDRADELVPVMTWDVIKEWEVIDEFDSEEYSGEYNIIAQMQFALHEWYLWEIREILGDLQREAEDE